MPVELEYTNSLGEVGQLSGKTEDSLVATPTSTEWWKRVHPLRTTLVDDESRQRASYVATRKILADYLVPHRFEGTARGSKLRRSDLGYGVALNRAYLQEVLGHVRAAPATYYWGPMAEDEAEISGAPTGGIAAKLWSDATRSSVTWRNFFERKVLEWILTSVGGFVIVDSVPGEAESQADAEAQGLRPFLRFVPVSWLENWGRSDTGYRWIKLAETVDSRGPRDDDEAGFERRHVLYEIRDLEDEEVPGKAGVFATRYDEEGKQVGEEIDLGDVFDREGQLRLPLLECGYGEHPEVEYMFAGLLMGLDDIVIDLFNLQSEIREGYRDVSFGLLVHTGPDAETVQDNLEDGSRFIDLGDDTNARLERLSAESAEVQAGLQLLEVGLMQWSLSAKRKAAEATDRATARSGIALQAEFQLDLKPLLVEVVETLDAIESLAMFVAGQFAGYSPSDLEGVGVWRSTEFRLEDEASRIARVVKEYSDSLPLPSAAKVALAMRWLEASDLIDLEEEIEDPAKGGKATVREIVEGQLVRIADAEDLATTRQAEFPGGGGLF